MRFQSGNIPLWFLPQVPPAARLVWHQASETHTKFSKMQRTQGVRGRWDTEGKHTQGGILHCYQGSFRLRPFKMNASSLFLDKKQTSRTTQISLLEPW